jgi:5-methylcytosine-specific restriction endonuclease McrA
VLASIIAEETQLNSCNTRGLKPSLLGDIMAVFVIDKNNNPLIPCSEKRAHQLLEKKQAVAVRRSPFVIKLLDFEPTVSVPTLRLKLDPGSKITGMALLDGSRVIWLGELHHRTNISSKLEDRASIRRGRRARHTRYRASRFDNRSRPKGWLAPSLEARVNQVLNVVIKLKQYAPISSISLELVKFDMQKMANPEISGVEYQQGELWGYEVRAYIQEKFGHKCAYCGKADYEPKNHGLRYEIDHVVPRSKGGPDKVSNLVYACKPCNDAKGNMNATEFGHPEVLKMAKAPLKDAAAVNSVRWRLFNRLKELGLEIETGTGGRTKFNRSKLKLPKSHCIDAVCVGASTPDKIESLPKYFETWTAKGRGNRQIMQSDAFGFPRQYRKRNKRVNDFGTGDVVRIESCKYAGHTGRLVAREKGPYVLKDSKRLSCSYKNLVLIQRQDGWERRSELLVKSEKC